METKDVHILQYSDVLTKCIESMIDSRFKYLKELEYENHTYARDILEKEYKPSVELLKSIVEKNS